MTMSKYLVGLLLSIMFAAVHTLPVEKKTLYKQEQWDHLLFVQQNPAGVCYYSGAAEGKGYTCNYPENATTWTMHGMWPTSGSTKGPNFCQHASFNLSSISALIPRLVMEWTNLLNETAFESFWSHEWLKHGTCLGAETEYEYFSKVLELFENGLNFGKVLADQGVTPGDSYTIKEFTDAFNQGLGVDPYLTCEYSQSTGQIVKQIYICLDSSYSPINCPGKVYSNCRENEAINYINSIYSRK